MTVCCSLFHAVEQILHEFWDQFISVVDANVIVFELEYKGILSEGDLAAVSRSAGVNVQNELLRKFLKQKCTDDALMEVCDVIIAVQNNQRMNQLGRNIKSKLERKCCVCVCHLLF